MPDYELISLLKILTSDDYSGMSVQERLEDLAIRSASNFQTLSDLIVQMQAYENTIGMAINSLVGENYSNWNNAAQNYNNRNDRISATPATPVVSNDEATVNHVENNDGSVDLSFEWDFADEEGDEYDIDGFIVYVWRGDENELDSDTRSIQYVPADARYVFLHGVTPDIYYYFGVAAYRMVDLDVAPEKQSPRGILKSGTAMADAYRPCDNPVFKGDIQGTIDGVKAEIVAGAATNFDSRNDRISVTPATPTVPSAGASPAVAHTVNDDGSVDVYFKWVFDCEDEDEAEAYNIDGFVVYVRQSTDSGAYAFGSSPGEEQAFFIPASKRVFVLYGVPANKYYTLGVQAYRNVDPDIEADGILQSDIVKSAGNGEDPYKPEDNVAFAGNLTGLIDGTAVSVVSTLVKNFDDRNDRIATKPADPVIADDGTAVDHTVNSDGSVDISLEWEYEDEDGSGDEGAYNVDGFIVHVYHSSLSAAYEIGDDPNSEQSYYVQYDKRAIILFGMPADKYYTFGIQAYRMVDQDIDDTGIIKSNIVQPAREEEDPYRPESSLVFGGDITGTIDGISADEISGVISGTLNYRTGGAPSNAPLPTTISVTENANATINIKVGWGKYTQGEKPADFLMLFWVKGDAPLSAPTVNDSSIVFNVNTGGASYYIFEGVNPAENWRFGIAAVRRTESGIEIGAIQAPADSPDWADITKGFTNYTGTIGDSDHPSDLVVSVLDGFGNGEDGDFDSDDHADWDGLVTFNVSTEDMHPVVKQYKSFNLKSGHTIRPNKRNQGLFIFCQGLFVCEGTIDQDGLGAKISKDKIGQSIVQIPVGIPRVRIVEGGKGGAGGGGGDGSGNKDDNRGFGGSGSGPSDPTFCGGAFGGAGGGGGAGRGSNADRSGLDGGDAGTSLLDEAVGPGGTGSQGDPGGTGGNLAGGGGGSGGGPYSAPPGGGGGGVKGGKQGVWQYTAYGTAADGDSGGGSPGGLIVICAKQIMITGLITANGADGADGGHGSGGTTDYGNGGGGGGQGGGGGGVVVTVSEFLLTFGTITVNGGLGGQGGAKGTGGTINTYVASDGLPGQAGAVGTIINVQV